MCQWILGFRQASPRGARGPRQNGRSKGQTFTNGEEETDLSRGILV